MEITVISEEENPMLHRTDVRFRVSHAEESPDRLAVRDSLAARLNKSADEVVVRKLDTKFGMRETLGEAKVYQGPDFAKDVEQEHMLVRNKIGEDIEAEPEVDAEEAAEPDVEEDAAEDAEAEEEPEPEEAEAEDEPDEEEAEVDEESDDADADAPDEEEAEPDDEPDEADADASDEDADDEEE